MLYTAGVMLVKETGSAAVTGGWKVKVKGKDVDLYSAFHAPGTANAHVTETGPSDRYLGHRQAC